jgi:hypothetical protein
MPVRKMQDITEATVLLAAPLRGENLRSALELSAVCLRLHPSSVRPGVRRFQSIEEGWGEGISGDAPARNDSVETD